MEQKIIKDFIFDEEKAGDIISLLTQYSNLGFQSTLLTRAIEIIRSMKEDNECTKFLTFTANMVASGLRGVFVELVKRGYVDIIITTGGSIDHDIIRCYKSYLLGSFEENDVELHREGVNRIGNILVPNDRYEFLEKWVRDKLNKIYEGGEKVLSPSELIMRFAEEIENKNSILYWCKKKNIPIYCPGITDSAIGLQLYFFQQEHPDFMIDVVSDLSKLISKTLISTTTGAIILGGGISKHHTIGVNILRGGLDYSVYITTASPYDGSLSGAPPREAKSWGKISENAKTVTVHGDVTLILPLIFAGLEAL